MSYVPNWAENEHLNSIERVKLKKDGLEIIQEIIEKYAVEGYDSIAPEDINLLKWAGVYAQKPKNGFLMVRVRVDSSVLTAEQVAVLGKIAKQYARNVASISTRGAIQFHWVEIKNLPAIFKMLEDCGLSTVEACGDCLETIVGNPLAGVDAHELFDTTGIVRQITDFFLLNRDFSNLPRKIKISISSSTENAAYSQINDLSFTPAIKELDGKQVAGFHVWVGGGLSTNPQLAQKLNLFIKPQQVLQVTERVCTVFRDYGNREKRTKARLKALVMDWGIDKFQEMLNLPPELHGVGEDKVQSWSAAYYYGVHPQRQDGKNYVGFGVPLGELTSEHLYGVAQLAQKYGDSMVRTTLSQNLILTGVNDEDVPALLKEPLFRQLPLKPESFIDHTVVCTGNKYCNLAIVETKDRAKEIVAYLDKTMKMDEPIRIHIAGCPNSCGQQQIGDISLQGAKLKTDNGIADAFDVYAGGTLDGKGQFAQKLDIRVKAEEAQFLLEKILRFYQENRTIAESFFQFFHRVGKEAIVSVL